MENRETIAKIGEIIRRTHAVNVNAGIKFSENEEIYRICADNVNLIDIGTKETRSLPHEELPVNILEEVLTITENAEGNFNQTLRRHFNN